MTALLMMFALGCAKDPAPAETPAANNPTTAAPTQEEPPAEQPPADEKDPDKGTKGPPNFGGNVNVSADPKAAYEKYRDRLEGKDAAGECSADSECAPAGCSQEVCVPSGAEITTTCEVLPVYTILDSCGCVDTKCQWTLKQ